MSLLVTLAKATGGIVAVAAIWLAVDRAWRRMFPGRQATGCGGCASCRRPCDKRTNERT